MLAVEFLVRGATQFGEPGVFMMFEENAAELTGNVRSPGFDPDKLAAQKIIALDYDAAAIKVAASAPAAPHYVLRLYITGSTPCSIRAISNIRSICEEHLEGRYDLEVVDISRHPMLAEGEQIIAAPTLIKKLPLPLRRFIGDMSETERILIGLDLRKSVEMASPAGNS